MNSDERVKMYNKLTKEELIQLLVDRDSVIDKLVLDKTNKSMLLTESNKPKLYSEICPCNTSNGGNGICGCVMANKVINESPSDHKTTDFSDLANLK